MVSSGKSLLFIVNFNIIWNEFPVEPDQFRVQWMYIGEKCTI